jgi:hypothetical protein
MLLVKPIVVSLTSGKSHAPKASEVIQAENQDKDDEYQAVTNGETQINTMTMDKVKVIDTLADKYDIRANIIACAGE